MMRMFYTAFAFGITGLLAGLHDRELTKIIDFPDRPASQLPLVHTHFLVLGFIFLLLVLALEKTFSVSSFAPRSLSWFYWLGTAGVALARGVMPGKGTLVVRGADADSPALAGIAGLGHSAPTVAIMMLFVSLHAAVKDAVHVVAETPQTAVAG